ncbi:MAG: hypothetical protein ACYDCQ_16415 [Dehalococcoidia bacterium]
MTSGLAAKGPGHDQRRCRFLIPNPNLDRAAIPDGVDRARLPLFLCLALGEAKPLITTMVKCRFCRTTQLWYEPREDSPDFAAGSGPVRGEPASA